MVAPPVARRPKLFDFLTSSVGVVGGLLGVHRGLRDVIDDTTMNALFNQEAKLFLPSKQWQNKTVIRR